MRAIVLALLLLGTYVPASAQATRPHKPRPSPFAWRGIVEGYYGTAWTHADRVRVLKWMGDHGFNAYVHAPKADAYQTRGWRTPYPAGDQARFDQEIQLARRRGVQWIPNLSPERGPPTAPTRLCFSCPGDLEAVVAKLRPFLDAGVRTVMISFDDIGTAFGPADAAAYAARYPGTPVEYQFARAQTEFLNALHARLGPDVQLLTVLTDYAGTVDSPYLQGVRAGALDPSVGVLWTGPHIRASDFSAADAAAYGALVGRTPIVWANWVAHDFVPSRLFLGPFRKGRDVTGAVQGFFFSPMNEPDLNMLPLATAGAWMRDPKRYDHRAAWLAAVDELAGRDGSMRDELRAWAETSYSSGLTRQEAPTAARLQHAFLRAFDRGARWTDARDALRHELVLTQRARSDLRHLRNHRIARQARPFLAIARRAARAAERGLDLLAAERPSLSLDRTRDGFAGTAQSPDPAAASALRDRMNRDWTAARASPLYVYGCRVRTRGCGGRTTNVVDNFLTQVTALDGVWQPDAARAARRLRVTLAGKRVRRDRAGRFTLPADSCGGRVLATDGAGGETSLPLPRCPHRRHGG